LTGRAILPFPIEIATTPLLVLLNFPERGMLNLTGTCLKSGFVFRYLGMQIVFLHDRRCYVTRFLGLVDLAIERISLQQLMTELRKANTLSVSINQVEFQSLNISQPSAPNAVLYLKI